MLGGRQSWVWVLAILILAPPMCAQQKIAIIIQGQPHTTGVSDDDPKWADDSMAANVADMAKALSAQHYKVSATTTWVNDLKELDKNAPLYQTKKSFITLVKELKDTLGPDDQVIIYYTGHGNKEPQFGTVKKTVRHDPDDFTNSYSAYMDINGAVGGPVTGTQFRTALGPLAEKSSHINIVIDDCYAGMLSVPLSHIEGVESVYLSSRFDEPSYAGSDDMAVQLHWKPGAPDPGVALASLKLPKDANATIQDDLDLNGRVTGKKLVMTRPTGEKRSAFSYGFINGINGAPLNSTTTASQLLDAGFKSAWQYDPTAVAGLLDWRTTKDPFIATAAIRSPSDTRKALRKGHTHPSGYHHGKGSFVMSPGSGGAVPEPGTAVAGPGGATPGSGGATPGPSGATPGPGGAVPTGDLSKIPDKVSTDISPTDTDAIDLQMYDVMTGADLDPRQWTRTVDTGKGIVTYTAKDGSRLVAQVVNGSLVITKTLGPAPNGTGFQGGGNAGGAAAQPPTNAVIGTDIRPGDYTTVDIMMRGTITQMGRDPNTWTVKRNPGGSVTYTSPDGKTALTADFVGGGITVQPRSIPNSPNPPPSGANPHETNPPTKNPPVENPPVTNPSDTTPPTTNTSAKKSHNKKPHDKKPPAKKPPAHTVPREHAP